MRAPNPRRAELRALSAQVKPLVKAGVFGTVNEGLISLYTEQTGAAEWHTFQDWRKAGRPVKKGERGYPIWGTPRPRNGAKGEQPAALEVTAAADDHAESWYPVAYLFHAGQVEALEVTTEGGA